MNTAFLSEDSGRTQVSRATLGGRGGGRLRTALIVLLMMSSGLFASVAGAADQPIRIGALTPSWGPTPATVGLRDGLQELGYRENEDFVLGVRFTQGDEAALPTAARQLVQSGVDLLFTETEDATQAAQQATSQIPIVFVYVDNPVESGLVQSFARPGGNITGVSNLYLKLGPKRLEVFQELVPALKRVLYLYNATDTTAVAEAQVYRDAGRRLGVELVEQGVRTEAEVQTALAQVRLREVDGILRRFSLSLACQG